MLLVFAIVVGILASLGIVAFFIGIIITLRLVTTMMYAAYEDIFLDLLNFKNLVNLKILRSPCLKLSLHQFFIQ